MIRASERINLEALLRKYKGGGNQPEFRTINAFRGDKTKGVIEYLPSQIDPDRSSQPAVHFPVADDTVECAYNGMRKHFPQGSYPEFGKDIVWPIDRMVLKVKKGENGKLPKIEQFMGEVSEYTFGPPQNVCWPLAAAKYPSPTAQVDTENLIQPGPGTYRDDGY